MDPDCRCRITLQGMLHVGPAEPVARWLPPPATTPAPGDLLRRLSPGSGRPTAPSLPPAAGLNWRNLGPVCRFEQSVRREGMRFTDPSTLCLFLLAVIVVLLMFRSRVRLTAQQRRTDENRLPSADSGRNLEMPPLNRETTSAGNTIQLVGKSNARPHRGSSPRNLMRKAQPYINR